MSTAAIAPSCFSPRETDDPAIPGDPFKRVRYTYGQLLGAEDFKVEQRGNVLRDRLHQGALHGAGTVCGLSVDVERPAAGDPADPVPSDTLVVQPGLAVDAYGRNLWVPRTQCLPVRNLNAGDDWKGFERTDADETAPDGPRRAWVVLRYRACESEPIPAIRPPCNDAGESLAYSRIHDSFEICLVATPPPDPQPPQREWHAFEHEPGEGDLPDLRDRLLAATLRSAESLSWLWSAEPVDEVAVLLAEVGFELEGDGEEAVTRVAWVDNRVRPLLPPVQLVAEEAFGHRLVGPDPESRLRLVSVDDSATTTSTLELMVTLSGDHDHSTLAGALTLSQLTATGWKTLTVDLSEEDGGFAVKAAIEGAPASTVTYQLHLAGERPAPLVDTAGQPFAGWWDEPRARAGRGRDASHIATWTETPE